MAVRKLRTQRKQPTPRELYVKMPTERVKGRVAWLNRSASVKELASQLGLEKGHVVMLPFLKDLRKGRIVFVKKEPASSRSLLLQQRYWREPRTKRLFRDFDAKGVGLVRFGVRDEAKAGKIRYARRDVLGLASLNRVKYDARLGFRLHVAGVRVALPLAVIKLEDIDKLGVKLKEIRRAAMMNESELKYFYPGVLIRAMSVKTRVMDLGIENTATRQALIEDAKKVVTRELYKKRVLSDDEYARWFAAELGKSLGIMHAQGYLHRGINTHNVTLAAELVDLSTATKLKKPNENLFRAELRSAGDVIGYLKNFVGGIETSSLELKKIMEKNYRHYNKLEVGVWM
jgi:hypothetical protein